MIPFDPWAPDQAALGAAIEAKNVVPYAKSYGPLRGLLSFTEGLTASCVGATWAKTGDGTVFNFAGDASKLYRLSAGVWSNVSKAGNYANVTGWEFARHGDRIIAANLVTPTQYFDMGSSALFADLPNAPQSATVANVRNFLVLGNIDDGSDYPDRVTWSGYDNTEIWTPSRATQSDRRDLGGGKIQRIVSGQVGVIFQETSIWVMRYAGPPTIFTLDEVEKDKGTPAPCSVVRVGANVYYLGQDGFYRFGAGGSEPIGAERVDRWFFREAGELESVRASADFRNHLVIWTFRTSSSLKRNNRMLIYNWVADRWSYAEVETEVMVNLASSGYDLDTLDSVLTSGIDASSIPVDSPVYQGGEVALTAFDSTHKAATFSGDYLIAELDTKEMGEGAYKSRFRALRPVVDGASYITARLGTRDSQADNVSWGLPKVLNTVGEFNFRKRARYNRVRLYLSGGFNHALGVDITEARKAGRR